MSEYDEARLQYRLDEMENAGMLYSVPPNEAGEWSSPAFIVDRVGDILGRVVTPPQSSSRRRYGDLEAMAIFVDDVCTSNNSFHW